MSTTIESVILEVDDVNAATTFYAAAFELGTELRLRESEAPTSGFRGFTMSLVVSQPGTVHNLFDSAVKAGGTVLKSVEKSLWGVGGAIQAPDGTVWNIATSQKKDTGPATRQVDDIVLLLGVENVGETKKLYADKGFTVGKSFGSYVDFAMPSSPVKLGLYKRRALAKSVSIAPEGTGSHRITIVSSAGPFTDPDGFNWENGL